jgi:hypothetical protein
MEEIFGGTEFLRTTTVPDHRGRYLHEIQQWAEPRLGMELLLHGGRRKGDVLWCSWSEEDPERLEADSREGKAATLQ